MLFAEEFGPVTITTIATAVLGAVVSAALAVIAARRASKKEDREEQRKDEDTILGRAKELYERQKKQCDEDKAELNARIDAQDERLVRAERTIDKLRQVYAGEVARRKYTESVLRTAGVKYEAWDNSTAELPSVDLDPPDKGGAKP